MHIREYIGKNHEYSYFDSQVHQVEYYFVCHSVNGGLEEPSNPDHHQVGMEWIYAEDMLEYRIYPKAIRKHIINYKNNKESPVNLGNSN